VIRGALTPATLCITAVNGVPVSPGDMKFTGMRLERVRAPLRGISTPAFAQHATPPNIGV
jgi:hypothetical protein